MLFKITKMIYSFPVNLSNANSDLMIYLIMFFKVFGQTKNVKVIII